MKSVQQSLGDSLELALAAQVGLKLGEHAKHVEKALPSRGARINRLLGCLFAPLRILMQGIVLVRLAALSPATAQTIDGAPNAEPRVQTPIPCPLSGNATTLRGVASQQSVGGRGTVWVLKTDQPFCLTLTSPVAPRQRAILSSVEIDGAVWKSSSRAYFSSAHYRLTALSFPAFPSPAEDDF
jgi:hypothetical protein